MAFSMVVWDANRTAVLRGLKEHLMVALLRLLGVTGVVVVLL